MSITESYDTPGVAVITQFVNYVLVKRRRDSYKTNAIYFYFSIKSKETQILRILQGQWESDIILNVLFQL